MLHSTRVITWWKSLFAMETGCFILFCAKSEKEISTRFVLFESVLLEGHISCSKSQISINCENVYICIPKFGSILVPILQNWINLASWTVFHGRKAVHEGSFRLRWRSDYKGFQSRSDHCMLSKTWLSVMPHRPFNKLFLITIVLCQLPKSLREILFQQVRSKHLAFVIRSQFVIYHVIELWYGSTIVPTLPTLCLVQKLISFIQSSTLQFIHRNQELVGDGVRNWMNQSSMSQIVPAQPHLTFFIPFLIFCRQSLKWALKNPARRASLHQDCTFGPPPWPSSFLATVLLQKTFVIQENF